MALLLVLGLPLMSAPSHLELSVTIGGATIFSNPTYAVCVDAHALRECSRLVVSDTGHALLRVYDVKASSVSESFKVGLGYPTGLAVGSGSLFVAGQWEQGLKRIAWDIALDTESRGARGDIVASAGARDRSEPNSTLESALGVAISGRLSLVFVADVTRHRVLAFDVDTLAHVRTIVPPEAAFSGLTRPFSPHGIAVSGGKLYVSDADNRCVWLFAEVDGRHLRTLGGPRDDLPSLFPSHPRGVAVGRGRIFVAEARRIHMLGLDGGPLQPPFEVPGAEAILGLSIHGRCLYATDPQQHKVFVVQIRRLERAGGALPHGEFDAASLDSMADAWPHARPTSHGESTVVLNGGDLGVSKVVQQLRQPQERELTAHAAVQTELRH